METAELRLIRRTVKTSSCWEWHGYCDPGGYGRININGKIDRTHRIAYRLFKGEIPAGCVIDHLCGNRACLNPEHLEAVTQKENIFRSGKSIAKIHKDKTHCMHGHELSGDNLRYYKARNERICRQCHRDSYRKRGC